MIIAGIGSRKAPVSALQLMRAAGGALAAAGHTGRSGGAAGCDTAFAEGFGSSGIEIFTDADATPESIALAAKYHPAWDRCSDYAKRLHGRNCQILLGRSLTEPVDAILCWTPGGAVTGGTGQALRIASDPIYSIPIFNLATQPLEALWLWMWNRGL
jgi:hypothetical protein